MHDFPGFLRYDNDGFNGQVQIFDGPLIEPVHRDQPLQKSGRCNEDDEESPVVYGYRSVVCRSEELHRLKTLIGPG